MAAQESLTETNGEIVIGTVKHGGSFGDVIYGLWSLKKMGGCKTLLISDKNMTPRLYGIILPLLRRQPYIGEVRYITEGNGNYHKQKIDVDLDVFRADISRIELRHLAQAHVNMLNKFYRLGLPDFDGAPWLENIPKPKHDGGYVSVNRSFRYRNPRFDYFKYIRDNTVKVVGNRSEFEDFQKTHPLVNCTYEPTDDLLGAASVILGSAYFVGNQSAGSALAQGMGHPQVQEFYPEIPDCRPSVNVEGFPYFKDWKVRDDDYIVTMKLVEPQFNVPRCDGRNGHVRVSKTRR